MKTKLLLLTAIIFISVSSFSQRVEMKVGEKIKVEKIMNKKKTKINGLIITQNGKKVKYVKMLKTLKGIDVCSENIKKAKKHRTGAIVMTFIGVATMPLGYLILVYPIISQKRKELKYVSLAIEDYNNSLE